MQFKRPERGGAYSPMTRVGNWNEDMELEEIKLKEFLKRKETGSLLVLTKQARLEKALRPISTSVDTDRYLRFGDKIQLKNIHSESLLSADNDQLIHKDIGISLAVSTTPIQLSCAKNVFTIVSVHNSEAAVNKVRYGTLIRLKLESLTDNEVYLRSEAVSETACSRLSRRQEVTMSPVPNGETIWQIVPVEGKDRLALQNQPINLNTRSPSCSCGCKENNACFVDTAGCTEGNCCSSSDDCSMTGECTERCSSCRCEHPFLLRHVSSGSFLASDKSLAMRTLSGIEFETHCHSYLSTNKVHVMFAERRGTATAEHALRRQGTQNQWTIISGCREMQH